jgi:hypothetical protein
VANSKVERHPFRPKIRRVDHDDNSLDAYPATAPKTRRLLNSSGGMAPFIRQLPNGVRPWGSACFNSKLSHLINQRGTRQSKPIGRSALSSDHPVGSLQCFEDMLPIGVGKRA